MLRGIARYIRSCFSSEYVPQKLEESTQERTNKESGFSSQHTSNETIDKEHAESKGRRHHEYLPTGHFQADKETQTLMRFLDSSQISLESGYKSGHQSTETINEEHAESKGRRPKEYVRHGQFQTNFVHEVSINATQDEEDKDEEKIARACLHNRQYDEAIVLFVRELHIAQKQKDIAKEGRISEDLGKIFFNNRQYDEAAKFFENSLNCGKKSRDTDVERRLLEQLGDTYFKNHQYIDAIDHYKKALTIVQERKDKNGEIRLLQSLGDACKNNYQYAEAIDCYEDALRKDESPQENLLISLAQTYKNNLQPDEAFDCYKKALGIFPKIEEEEKNKLQEPCNKRTEVVPPHLSSLSHDTLLDRVSSNVSRSVENGSCLFYTFGRNDALHILVWQGKDVFHKQCQWKTFTGFNPVACLQRNMKGQRKYLEKRKTWPIRFPQKDFSDELLSSGSSTQYPSEGNVQVQMTTADSEDLDQHFRSLYSRLISPINEQLTGTKLVIVPCESLFNVPFSALLSPNGQRLCEQYSIQVTLSPEVFSRCPKKPLLNVEPSLFVGKLLARPAEALGQEEVSAINIASAQIEATIFCHYFQSESLAIEEATKKNVRKKMENASIINIAIHGNLVDGNIFLAPTSEPLASGAEDSYPLTAKDIKDCALKAHLVVLNFDDGGGSVVSAKDLITIVSSFLESGAHSILVKLWETNEEATRKFMQTFHENVCHGISVHMALRRTMMSLMVEHPVADWSGYQIFGEDITLTENDIKAIRWQTSTR